VHPAWMSRSATSRSTEFRKKSYWKDPRENEHMGASATAKINRRDFGVSSMAGMVGEA